MLFSEENNRGGPYWNFSFFQNRICTSYMALGPKGKNRRSIN
jgi:hypothetical protein